MATAFLTRRITFSAAHRYRLPDLSDAENERRFGPCARPNYHGHNYTCELTVRGPIDERTGMIVDLGEVDRVLKQEVHARFDHANLNLDVPEFGEGRLMPTSENLARFIFARARTALAGVIEVCEVRVAEDATLSASYRGD